MEKRVMIIGGGGHAKVVIDCIRAAGDTPIGILDDKLPVGTTILEVPVLGTIAQWQEFAQNVFIIAIGNNEARAKIAEQLPVQWYSAVHPRAVISAWATLGQGTVVMPGAAINAGAGVGNHCIINTCAVVEHDCVLEDYVHISPNAALGGTVTVGAKSHIGIGASVRNNVTICEACVVGAGAVVVKNITETGTYVGVPAQKMK